MRIASVLLVLGAVVLALPFGWGLGVLAAYTIAGPDFGQLPVGTVPVALLGSVVFALLPSVSAKTRFAVMASGTVVFVFLAWMGWPV